jgi:methyl-accepting chemotaxis protein
MKLNLKFSLSTAVFSLSSAILSIFLIFSFINTLSLREYQLQTGSAVTEWFKLRIYLSDLFTVAFDTENVANDWAKRRTSFSDKFKKLADDSKTNSMSKETRDLYKNLSNLFELISPILETLDDELNNINNDNLSMNTKQSLARSGINFVFNSTGNTDSGSIAMLYLRLSSALQKMNTYSDPFQETLENYQVALEKDASRTITRITIQSFVLLAIVSILVYFFFLSITSKITRRLKTITLETEMLATKDLTRAISDRTRDEIGELSHHLNETVSILNSVMASVKATANEATEMSESINFSAGEVTAATTEISSNIGSMQHQFGNLKQAVDNAIDALDSMSSFLVTFMTDINRQNSSVTETTTSITEMNRSIALISRKGKEKVDQITQIRKIAAEGEEKIVNTESLLVGVTTELDNVYTFIEMINSIAEQTSILSMNAAIESAHAGEAGKGFAVVADEIQKLAESTTENAQLINSTLTDIIANVQEARNSSQIATHAFTDTTEVIGELVDALNDIVDAINEIDTSSGLIAERSSDIAGATKELSSKTDKLDSLRKTVMTEIQQMESIFSESSGGIAEINTGTEDILAKIMNIHDLSTRSKNKMVSLHGMLNEFKTHKDDGQHDAESLDDEAPKSVSGAADTVAFDDAENLLTED